MKIKSILFVGIIVLFISCGGGNGGGGSSSDTPDIPDTGSITDAQSNSLLYTVYAGIGYMDKTNPDDNEKLYNVMIDDLTNLLSTILIETLVQDPDATDKLIEFYTSLYSNTQTFVYAGPAYTATLILSTAPKKGSYKGFNGDLTVDFNSTGYTVGDNTYKSLTTGVDLTAETNGYYKAYYQLYPFEAGIEELLLKSVKITAAESLTASCPFGNVGYDDWDIELDIYYGDKDPTYTSGMKTYPINLAFAPDFFLPEGLGSTDFRDYTVNGGINVDGDACVFNAVRYIQNQFDYLDSYTGAGRQTWVLMQVNGFVTGPGMTEPVEVSSLINTGDPGGSGTIVTHIYSVNSGQWDIKWSMGELSISAGNGLVSVEFDDGTANFSGDLGAWSVASWQDDLDPLSE